MVAAQQWDSVKFDGCSQVRLIPRLSCDSRCTRALLLAHTFTGVHTGLNGGLQFHDTVLWASLLEATQRPIAVENCGNTHPPTPIPDPLWPHGGECPYNW